MAGRGSAVEEHEAQAGYVYTSGGSDGREYPATKCVKIYGDDCRP